MVQDKKGIIHQIIWYLVIFSIIGLIIETLYCHATMGIWESRKGLIWGPFCPVYGVGATFLILCLNKFKGRKIKLFFYGALIGSLVEYILSFMLEAIFGTRFWDYSYTKYHLNGRICYIYTFFWAILSVVLVEYVKPLIDKFINKISGKKRDIIDICIVGFLILDVIITIWAINAFTNRVKSNEVDIKIEQNAILKLKKHVEDKYFTNQYMIKNFPNLRSIDENGNEVWIRDLLKEKESKMEKNVE